MLPRAKPLPKPKPPTKWEQFASAKGIQKKVRDKKVWDEEKQDWVNRWGRDGKNKQLEDQWITEVPANAGESIYLAARVIIEQVLRKNVDVGHNPATIARTERKERVAKNERQRSQNAARAQGPPNEREERKKDIEKTLATTRISTASMGKFDNKLEGEKKLKGVKRKVSRNSDQFWLYPRLITIVL